MHKNMYYSYITIIIIHYWIAIQKYFESPAEKN